MAEASVPSLGDLHDDQLVALLRSGAHAALLIAYFGEPEYRELAHLAKLAVTRRNPRGRRVFVLPGIMGSRLGLVARRSYSLLWLHPTAVANGSLMQLAMPSPRALRAVGVMLPGYLKLRLRLEIAGFRPVFCPFDWRRDVDQLARAVRTLDRTQRRTQGTRRRPQHGRAGRARGARVRQAAHREADPARRSERRIVRTAAGVARGLSDRAQDRGARSRSHARSTSRAPCSTRCPASTRCCLRPGALQSPTCSIPRNWPADELAPDPKLLARARKIRAQLPAANERCNVIVGVGQETIVSVALRERGFQYEFRAEGDGTVPLARAAGTDAATWFVNENHGALTKNDLVLAAVADILKTGDTRRLRTTAPTAPQAASSAMSRKRSCARSRCAKCSGTRSRSTAAGDSRPVLSPEFLASESV